MNNNQLKFSDYFILNHVKMSISKIKPSSMKFMMYVLCILYGKELPILESTVLRTSFSDMYRYVKSYRWKASNETYFVFKHRSNVTKLNDCNEKLIHCTFKFEYLIILDFSFLFSNHCLDKTLKYQ